MKMLWKINKMKLTVDRRHLAVAFGVRRTCVHAALLETLDDLSRFVDGLIFVAVRKVLVYSLTSL